MKPYWAHFGLFLMSLVLSGCVSFSTFQSAQTLDEGKLALTAGFVEESDSGYFVEAGVRYGISPRADFGLKVGTPYGVWIDYKHELIQTPRTVSFDMGMSVYSSPDHRLIAFYPMLITGTERWHVGVKAVYYATNGSVRLFNEDFEYDERGFFPPVIVIGGVLGNAVKFLPELNIFIPTDGGKIGFMPGIGVRLDL